MAEDETPLRRLFHEERGEVFALLPLPEEQKARLLDNQFDYQLNHYRQTYTDFEVFTLCRGGAVCGRVCLAREEDDVLLVDILIDRAWRGQGVGGALIQELQTHAAATGRGIRLHVGKASPALGLYQRLGFVVVADAGVAWAMTWQRVH